VQAKIMHSGLLCAIFWQVVDVLKGSKQKRHREGYSLSLVLPSSVLKFKGQSPDVTLLKHQMLLEYCVICCIC
jgi:hypothetical protein